jgi:gentisate 1,2-dioxygenase
MDTAPTSSSAAEREEFYGRLGPRNLAPLWEVLKDLVPPEPKSKATPFRWRYADIRPLLMESGGLLTAEEAERRVLVLENPSLVGQSKATATLYAGVQLIMPGETAPAHRHTPSALRFMIEGQGGFTSVGGERTTMRKGDFVITPAWAYHDHGNEGDGPVVWLDGLDIPMVAFFEAVFGEGYNDSRHSLTRPEGDSIARFGSGLLPIDPVDRYGQTSPIFNYPYERTREALLTAAKGQAPDPHLATTLRYANPQDGGWAMPTMATWVMHLEAGQETATLRSTDGMVVAIAEGAGDVTIGEASFDFVRDDVVAVPGWAWRSFKASSDCVLFCFSDRAAQEKLGLFREERAAA